MPLPMMAGDPAGMLLQPGMQGAPTPGPMTGAPTPTPVDPKQQVRGAVELVSQLHTSVSDQLEGLARQFPMAAQSAQQLVQLFNRALQDLVRDIVQGVQMPEPEAPRRVA